MVRTLRSLALYVASGAVCAATLVAYFRLWEADLRIPLYYPFGGDVSFSAVLVKTTVETGWFLSNPLLGHPGCSMPTTSPSPTSSTGALSSCSPGPLASTG